jgi:membrane protein required for colicin V production
VLLDLVVLAVLALAAVHGAVGGALRQVVQLLAAVVAWLAARHLGAAVAAGLSRWFPGFLARPGASALLFCGTFALVTLVGAIALRATSMARVVRGPADRGLGALLGGVKGGLIVWVLLSAVALAGGALPAKAAAWVRGSEYASLAHDHNLLTRIDPQRARLLERLVAVIAEARQAGAAASGTDEATRGLLSNPRVKALAESGARVDPVEAERLLDDPQVRELLEKIRERSGKR